MSLPTDSMARKDTPIFSGVLAYFPDAIAAVARVSKIGNDKHNPGQPLHWDRTKSMDHADCIARHLLEKGQLDEDGMSHTAHLAWRALALLQLEEEERVKHNPKYLIEDRLTGKTRVISASSREAVGVLMTEREQIIDVRANV